MSIVDNNSTIIFDSGAGSNVILLNDSYGNPTYGSWQQNMSIPFNVPNPSDYVVGLSSCVYRNPYGPIPNTENNGVAVNGKPKKVIKKTVEEDSDDDSYGVVAKLQDNLNANEDGSSSVIVYISFVGATSIGDESQRIIAVIPPNVHIDDDRNPVLAKDGAWPLVFTQTSTVIPWVQLSQNSFSSAIITFASSNGTIIPTNDLARPAPFKVTVCIRRKSEVSIGTGF